MQFNRTKFDLPSANSAMSYSHQYFQIFSLFSLLQELEESIDLASQAIAQKPSSYEGFYARAKARMEHGDLNEALADANEAMQKAAQSGLLTEVVEVLKRIQAELLTRITNEGRNQTSSSTSSGYEVCGSSVGAAANGAFESQHEMTDL